MSDILNKIIESKRVEVAIALQKNPWNKLSAKRIRHRTPEILPVPSMPNWWLTNRP